MFRVNASGFVFFLMALTTGADGDQTWNLRATAPWQPEYGEPMCRENAMEALRDQAFEASQRCRQQNGSFVVGEIQMTVDSEKSCVAEQDASCRIP